MVVGHVKREGLTLLSPGVTPGKPREPDCNVVFIHGLRGHPRKTWTVEEEKRQRLSVTSIFRSRSRSSPSRPSSTERRASSQSSRPALTPESDSTESVHTDVFWPEDLLPFDLPNSAIYTYGYDADLVDGYLQGASKSGVVQHSTNFMIDVASDIGNDKPIMFVAHSLGGIIVKDALFRSKNSLNPIHQHVHNRTYVVLFLGTPHRGSQASGWGGVLANVGRIAGIDIDKRLLRTLELGSEMLDMIHGYFVNMLHSQDFKVHTFREGKGMTGTRGLNKKVVEDSSSGIGDALETIETINANHMQMARYSSRDEDGYIRISRSLKQYAEEITSLASSTNKSEFGEQLVPVQTGSTVLHVACQEGQTSLVEELLSKGERIEAMDAKGRTPLHRAAAFGHAEIVYILRKSHANKHAKDNTGLTPMNLASDQEVLWLLNWGPEHSATDLHGDTFLHMLVKCQRNNAANSVEWAIRRGYNINSRDGQDNTPLICAVAKGARDITQLLIINGASLTNKSMEGYPPLVLAARNGHYDVVRVLLDNKASIEEPGPEKGRRALFEAAAQADGHSHVVRLLLNRGARVDQRDEDSWTELCFASSKGHLDIVRQLFEAGADVNDLKSPTNRHLPLAEASHWWHVHVMEYLLQKGADVELHGRMHWMMGGETVLIAAARARRPGVCQLLLRYGADVDFKDSGGNTAVDAAREAGDEAIAQLLLAHKAQKTEMANAVS